MPMNKSLTIQGDLFYISDPDVGNLVAHECNSSLKKIDAFLFILKILLSRLTTVEEKNHATNPDRSIEKEITWNETKIGQFPRKVLTPPPQKVLS